jgi:hypothetical protein
MTEFFSPQKGPSNGKKSTTSTLRDPVISHKSPQCDGSEVAASGGAQNHVTHGEAAAIKVQHFFYYNTLSDYSIGKFKTLSH